MDKKVEKLKGDIGKYKSLRTVYWGVILFAILIIVDQLTKVVADVYFSQSDAPERVAIIPGWIYLQITYNTGIAYGKFGDAQVWVKILIIAATAALMAVFAVLYFRIDPRRTFLRLAVIFIVAGGVGNLIDRLYFRIWDPEVVAAGTQGVRDMVNLERFGFAVCNFADFFITGGAVMLVLALLFFDRDALLPLGKKYKKLAKEAEDKKNALVAVKGKRAAEDYGPRNTDERDNG